MFIPADIVLVGFKLAVILQLSRAHARFFLAVRDESAFNMPLSLSGMFPLLNRTTFSKYHTLLLCPKGETCTVDDYSSVRILLHILHFY